MQSEEDIVTSSHVCLYGCAGQGRKTREDSKRQRTSSVTPDDAPAVAATCNAPLVVPGQHIGGSTPECLDRLSAAASAEDMRSLQKDCMAANQLSAENEQLSSSEDPASSPDSCFDSAFIPAGGSIGDLQQAAKHAVTTQVPPAPVIAPAQHQHQLRGGKVYRFGSIRSRSRLSVMDSGTVQAPSISEALGQVNFEHAAIACQAPSQPAQTSLEQKPSADELPCARPTQQGLHCALQPLPQAVAVLQTGNPTMAVANLVAGHTLARLPPAELALLIANHNGSDPALTQALQCAMSALSDAQLGNVG